MLFTKYFFLIATIPMNSKKLPFPVTLVNTEANSFNKILQLINLNYHGKKRISSEQRLLNKNSCDDVSSTTLLRTQTAAVGSKCLKN